ncbi:hypothetical protein KYB31_15500 [Clostridium felsineum]|uniref:hypothetical protein n=1 Tax=Clostridium felsineum TaxID=36839 RepID=UPI00214DA0AE|nr:hypothetical protein [Clostridium felsineum]MCR3760382.1 hypothetical protein [Clostridium felsineum]
MTNKIEVNPAPYEVNYSKGTLNIEDADTTINIAIGWRMAAKIAHDHLIELDDKEFKNLIKEVDEERNEEINCFKRFIP